MRKLLLSIKPQYVEEILSGRKKVEYRRRVHQANDVEWVLVYATSPIKRIVGEFKIKGILSNTPTGLWKNTCQISGISKSAYFTYFKDSEIAYAYQIDDIRVYETPLTLQDFGVSRAPQSFQYL